MSNNVDPDETAYYEPSHLDLCCLNKPIIIACGSERVNYLSVILIWLYTICSGMLLMLEYCLASIF